jgi:hypothetical protein
LSATVETLKDTLTTEYLAGLGAISQVRARLVWLREMLVFYGAAPQQDDG